MFKKALWQLIVVALILGGVVLLNLDKWGIRPRARYAPIGQLEWKTWAAEDGSYRVSLPGKPVRKTEEVSDGLGQTVTAQGLELELRYADALFFTFSFEIANEMNDPEAILDNT